MRAALILLALATPALASSDEAWEAFRADIAVACTRLAGPADRITVEVNPFGSEHYGAALVTVARDGTEERMVCIWDKQARTAELTQPFATE